MAGFPATPATPFTLPARNGPIIRHFISEYREGGMSCAPPIPDERIPKNKENRTATATRIAHAVFRACSHLMVRHPRPHRLREQPVVPCLDQLRLNRLSLTRHSRLGCLVP